MECLDQAKGAMEAPATVPLYTLHAGGIGDAILGVSVLAALPSREMALRRALRHGRFLSMPEAAFMQRSVALLAAL